MKYLLIISLFFITFNVRSQELVQTEKGAITIEYYRSSNGEVKIKLIKDTTQVYFTHFDQIKPLIADNEMVVNKIERGSVIEYVNNKYKRNNYDVIINLIRFYNKNEKIK